MSFLQPEKMRTSGNNRLEDEETENSQIVKLGPPSSSSYSSSSSTSSSSSSSTSSSSTQVIDVSSGDVHRSGVKPFTFVRQVMAVCLYPQLMKNKLLPPDVKLRAQTLLDQCAGRSVGSYSDSSGILHVRRSISEFITRRDAGAESLPQNIFITAGHHTAVKLMLNLLSSGGAQTPTGVLVPAPGPHSLRPLLVTCEVTLVPYRLRGDQDRGWALDLDQLHRALEAARGRCEPRALYVSNPGNPTGHVQDRKSIEDVIRFAAEENLMLLVDEVYQDSVLSEGSPGFLSYKRVLMEMDSEFTHTVQMVSFNSLSNACMGECGLRTGYMEVVNLDPRVLRVISIMLDSDICAPITGQIALDLMVDPPRPGDASYHTHTQERLRTLETLTHNARRALDFLISLPGISCEAARGGVYLFPRLHLTPEFTRKAQALQVEASVLYCQMFLEEEGVKVGAGSGETSDRHHLRLCVLVPPETLQVVLTRLRSFHLRLLEEGEVEDDRRGGQEVLSSSVNMMK